MEENKMTGFFCQDDYLKKIEKLEDEEVGRLFRACMIYHATGEEMTLELKESIAFDFIKADIDSAEQKYRNKCETNRKNRLSKMTDVDERQPSLTTDDERDQYNINKSNINEDNKKSSSKNIVKLKRFVPPTVEEIKAYCDERGVYLIDPQQFIDYYEARGWMLGKNRKMVDWKAAVRTWEKNERERMKERFADDIPY